MELLDDRSGYIIVYKHTYCIITFRKTCRLRAQVGGEILDIRIVGTFSFVFLQLTEENPIIILCTEKGNFQDTNRLLLVETLLQNLLNRRKGLLLVNTFNLNR